MPTVPEEFDTGLRPEELDPKRPRPLTTPWGAFALYTVADGAEEHIVCAPSFCPHLDGPLFEGSLAGNEITCPWHAWRFSLTTGACTYKPENWPAPAAPLPFCAVSIGARGTVVLARPPYSPLEPVWPEGHESRRESSAAHAPGPLDPCESGPERARIRSEHEPPAPQEEHDENRD